MEVFYICAAITAASAFTSLGFSLSAVKQSNGTFRINALYASSRSIALAAVSLIPFLYHSVPFLAGIALTMILVQIFDAIVGIFTHELLKIYGPAMTAVINLGVLVWLLRSQAL
jgi:hypothetical protein